MIRVRSAVDPERFERREALVELSGEGDGHVRGPERGNDLEAGGPEVGNAKDEQHRESNHLAVVAERLGVDANNLASVRQRRVGDTPM